MAKRQSLGRGLGALIPDVSRETTTAKPKSGTGAKPAKKVASPAPKKAAPSTKSTAKPAKKTATPAIQSPNQAPAAIAGLTFAELPVRSITPNAQQPRQVFDDEALAELVHSIQEVGLMQWQNDKA